MVAGWELCFFECCGKTWLTGLVGNSSRVAQTFCLECIARGRPLNWLLRRFYRVRLPWPLETSVGAPCGRTGNDEGGRTAPNIRHVEQ